MNWLFNKLRRMRLNQRNRREIARLIIFHLDQLRRYGKLGKLFNAGVGKLERLLRRSRVIAAPYRYRIEPISACNLRCPACAAGLRNLGRPAGLMSLDLYRNIIDQIAPFALRAELYNYGEPLLHPHIFEMIRYAQSKGIAIILSSHLNNLTRPQARALVESGLSSLMVAIDGATQEVYEQYRRGGNLERVLANLQLLVDERTRAGAFYPFITARILIHRGNEHQIAAVRQLAHAHGADSFTTGPLYFDTTDPAQVAQWLPSIATRTRFGIDGQYRDERACAELWEHLAINWDGKVTPCCWFSDASHTFADGQSEPLLSVWHGSKYTAARRVFGQQLKPDDPPTTCAQCRGKPLFLQGQMSVSAQSATNHHRLG